MTQKIELIPNMLIELFTKRNITHENKFLNVIQTIETFHRRLRNNQILELPDFTKKKQDIVDSCPEQYKGWLKEKLYFANEPTLKQRLEELFQELNTNIKNHLFPNLEQLIKQAKDSRNYYTHYDLSLSGKELKGKDLFILTERLKLLLLILLLKEINIEQNKAYQIVKDSSNFLFNHIIVN